MTPPGLAARLLSPVAGALLLSACATVPGKYALAERDPLEKANRVTWGVNRAADKVVIKPVTQVYRAVTPRPMRQGVTNFFSNVTEPWSFVNNLLQGKPKRAARNLGRFAVNTTIGLGGLFDRASKAGIRPAPEDLGQTLAVWGVNGGPYIVLPLLGPSTLRDGIGSGVAAYADPVKIAINEAHVNVWYKRAYLGAYIISTRSDLIETGGDAFLETSLDPYAAARSAYLQLRTAEISDADENTAAPPPSATGVPAPVGSTTTPTPPPESQPGAPLPQSAAPLPGDEPGPQAPTQQPQPTGPQPSSAPLPQSAAPLPGDETPAAPAQKPQDKPKP